MRAADTNYIRLTGDGEWRVTEIPEQQKRRPAARSQVNDMTGAPAPTASAPIEAEGPSRLTLGSDHAYGLAFWRTAAHEEQAALELALAPLVDRLWHSDWAAGAVLARSTDGLRLVLHTQWVTSEACQVWIADLLGSALPVASDVDEFELAFTEPVGNDRPFREGDLVALGEFWIHDPANQGSLVAREPAAARAALRSPGMLSASFHRGLAGTRIVNLAQIETADAVTRLAAQPGFAAASGYWRDLARNEHHTYRLVRVVPPITAHRPERLKEQRS
jgi:hypothetical protein